MTRLARFAWSVLAFNLGVILWGAIVRATRSGDGCGSHWPLCNGEIVPLVQHAATWVEFLHRATSGLALLLVVALVAWARRARPRGDATRFWAWTSLAFIVSEALIGAGLVRFELVAGNRSMTRAVVMATHLVNTFFPVSYTHLTLPTNREV